MTVFVGDDWAEAHHDIHVISFVEELVGDGGLLGWVDVDGLG